MKKPDLPKLSDANYEIMRIVWDLGRATVPQVLEHLNAGRPEPLKRSSVQVQMTRLEEYGWLKHREEGRSFVFEATVPRDTTHRSIIQDLKERVFEGSAARLMQCLLSGQQTDEGELR
ncbi:MAG TPA: BlaI/MecI/CopY family transcriptional regulator, partial [Candidatus Aminicenantes bacterium]|nr:BlaI/MecI/CopY family transcriptional regulator [Candidatus Aminicenantes bacterium]